MVAFTFVLPNSQRPPALWLFLSGLSISLHTHLSLRHVGLLSLHNSEIPSPKAIDESFIIIVITKVILISHRK